jgi:hypothetical protein
VSKSRTRVSEKQTRNWKDVVVAHLTLLARNLLEIKLVDEMSHPPLALAQVLLNGDLCILTVSKK